MALRVFLVEDNADTRFMMAYLLREAGHEVHSAGSMQEALRELPRHRSELLLSDVGLPDGTGCELMQRLHEIGERPYGIAMSGYGAAADVAASLEAGFRHHIVKPVEAAVLEGLLRQAEEQLRAEAGEAHGQH